MEIRGHLSRFGDWLTANGYAKRTMTSYRRRVLFFVRWAEPKPELRQLCDITTSVLTNFVIDLATEPGGGRGSEESFRATNTVSAYLAALFKLFDFFLKQGLVLLNPVHEVERPRKHVPLPKDILTFQEILRLLSHLDSNNPKGLRNRTILELMYATGMRRAEVAGLNLSSVLLNEQLLRVMGKGNKERLIPVGEESWRCLMDYLQRGRGRMRAEGSQALFLSSRGGRVHMQMVLRDLRKAAKRAGLKKRITLHGIRHSVATHLLAKGADIRHIQVFLGHSQLSTTQIYTRVEVSDLRKMLDTCHPRDTF